MIRESGMAHKRWFDSADFREQYHTDAPLGATCSDGGTEFALWAPTAQYVWLCLYDNGTDGEPVEFIELHRGDRGVWTHRDGRNLHGVYYQYDVTVDGVIRRTADPYARACGVNGVRSMVVDLARTNPEGWEEDRAPARQAEDIIYELHVKDFTWDAQSGVSRKNRGRYLGLCETETTLRGDGLHETGVRYLRSLGITHVQLQPVYDFGSVDEAGSGAQYNWGYDPVNYNIPEGSYASDPAHGEVRIREFKQAVKALHDSGLRVVMDVVYNHTYNMDTALFRTVPWYFYRQNPQGNPSNGSGCGNELASERSMVGRYILDSVMYWAEEYHIDGFRFDLMGLEDVGLMNRVRRALDRRFGKGEKLLYGEPWTGGRPHPRAGTRLAHKGNLWRLDLNTGAFCDCTRDAVRGSLFSETTRGFASGGDFNAAWLACCVRAWVGSEAFPVRAPSQVISYLSCHDDWTLWDKLVMALDPARQFEALDGAVLRASRLAAAILFGCQGRLFMLAGEEMGRTKRGVRNSYRSPMSVNRFDWQRAWDNRALVDYYRGLIALRKRLPGLCDKGEMAGMRIRNVQEPVHGLAVIEMDNRGPGALCDTLLLLVNAGDGAAYAPLPEGAWRVLADGVSSFVWQQERTVCGGAELPPVSALILGR